LDTAIPSGAETKRYGGLHVVTDDSDGGELDSMAHRSHSNKACPQGRVQVGVPVVLHPHCPCGNGNYFYPEMVVSMYDVTHDSGKKGMKTKATVFSNTFKTPRPEIWADYREKGKKRRIGR